MAPFYVRVSASKWLPFACVFPNAEEIDLLLEKLRPEEEKIVMFLHDTGLRVGEMTALLWKDVDLDKRMITIRDNKGYNDFCTVLLTIRSTRMLRPHQNA